MARKVLKTGLAFGDELNSNLLELYNKSNKTEGMYSILNYGITSVTKAIKSAILAASLTGGIVMIPTIENGTTYLIDDDIVVPSNVTLFFVPGAKLKGSAGTETITINGGMDENSFSQRFENISLAGSPKITGLYSEWFGAARDRITDDTTAIQTTVTNCINTGLKLKFLRGIYNIVGSVLIPKFVEIEGIFSSKFHVTTGVNGTVLYSKTTSADAILRFDFGTTDEDREPFSLKNIAISGDSGWNSSANPTARQGISIKNSSRKGVMENVTITGFTLEGLYLDSVFDSDFRTVSITWCGTDNTRAAFHVTAYADVTNACRFFGLHIEHCAYMFYIEKARHNTFIACKFEMGNKDQLGAIATTTPIRIASTCQELTILSSMLINDYRNGFHLVQIDNERTEIASCDFASGDVGGGMYIKHTSELINVHDNRFYFCRGDYVDSKYPLEFGSGAKFKDNNIWINTRDSKMYLCSSVSESSFKDNTIICDDSTIPTSGNLFVSSGNGNVYDGNKISGYFYEDYVVNVNNVYKDEHGSLLRTISNVDNSTVTPDVIGKTSIALSNNVAADYDNFVNGYNGQIITIIANDGNTTILDTSTTGNCELAGSVDWNMPIGSTLQLIKRADGVWLEVSRSVN